MLKHFGFIILIISHSFFNDSFICRHLQQVKVLSIKLVSLALHFQSHFYNLLLSWCCHDVIVGRLSRLLLLWQDLLLNWSCSLIVGLLSSCWLLWQDLLPLLLLQVELLPKQMLLLLQIKIAEHISQHCFIATRRHVLVVVVVGSRHGGRKMSIHKKKKMCWL